MVHAGGGRLVMWSVFCIYWSVVGFYFCEWSVVGVLISIWSVVGGSWSVVCGRWLVGGRWFCTTPFCPPQIREKSQTLEMAENLENRTNMDIVLLFLAKPLHKHGTTLVHNTYPPLLRSEIPVCHVKYENLPYLYFDSISKKLSIHLKIFTSRQILLAKFHENLTLPGGVD